MNDERFAQYIKNRYGVDLTELAEEFSEEYSEIIYEQYLAKQLKDRQSFDETRLKIP